VRSVAGLRAKAIDALSLTGQLWDEPCRDLDWGQHALRSLLEGVCALTGLDVPVEASDDVTVQS
jgi:hypothetical protein